MKTLMLQSDGVLAPYGVRVAKAALSIVFPPDKVL